VQTAGPLSARRNWIEPCPELSLRQQCELLGLSRSGYYYEPVPESEENLALMRRLDELNLAHPVYGSRRLAGNSLAVSHGGFLLCGRAAGLARLGKLPR
jgi:hypothetical protein